MEGLVIRKSYDHVDLIDGSINYTYYLVCIERKMHVRLKKSYYSNGKESLCAEEPERCDCTPMELPSDVVQKVAKKAAKYGLELPTTENR